MVDQNRCHNSTSQRLRFVLTILALYKFVCMYVCMYEYGWFCVSCFILKCIIAGTSKFVKVAVALKFEMFVLFKQRIHCFLPMVVHDKIMFAGQYFLVTFILFIAATLYIIKDQVLLTVCWTLRLLSVWSASCDNDLIMNDTLIFSWPVL